MYKNGAILYSLLFIGQVVFGQAGTLVRVPGTKCSLIPPDGFVAATTFSGFQQNETGSSIMINEVPSDYKSILEGFTADALIKKGMTLVSKESISFQNKTATLIKVTQPAYGTTYIKQLLLFGDDQTTIMVNGIYPKESKAIEGKIKDALLSTVYNPEQKEMGLDEISYSIDISNTEFKLAKFSLSGLIYSTDGKMVTENPIFLVGNSIAKVPVQNQKQYSIERLKKLPRGDQNVVVEMGEIKIDQLKGYEIIANGITKDGKPELIYQVMLFNDLGDYYIMIGQSKEDFTNYIAIFKKLALTFRRKS